MKMYQFGCDAKNDEWNVWHGDVTGRRQNGEGKSVQCFMFVNK